MALSFGFLKNCKPCELLRVKIEDTAEFAILGANEGHGVQALIVLKNDEPPLMINLLESGHMDGSFDTYAALRYGTCEILADHTDRCEIGVGPLFTKAGSLVLSDGSKSLIVQVKDGKSVRYFDLATGKVRGELGGARAAFKSWSLWHDGLVPAATSARIIHYSGG
jgi:hypothetical protein